MQTASSMTRLHRALTSWTLAALLGAGTTLPAAAQTYRIVGPDGKITYSDRKPTDPQLKTRQLGQKETAPLVSAGREPFELHTLATLPPGSRAAVPLADGVVPPVDVTGKPFPPGLPDAVLAVLVHQFFVQTLVETCSRVRPTFIERYRTGVRNWRDRNGEILDRSNRVTFARFTAEQRDLLRATGRARLAQLTPRPDASEAERVAWCDTMNDDLVRHQMDLVGDARMAPLLAVELP